ncbi:MAG TPA: DUF6515 family protein [Roseateles sp.]|nr:DUF6515 family protein [Roseateles sp.]
MKSVLLAALLTSSLLLGAGPASAQGHGPGPREFRGRMVYDSRFQHDRYYPAPGFVAHALPRSSLGISFGPDRFFFDSGVWYRPYGPRWRVIVPPVGVLIPILPSAHVALRVGGAPYYYANGVYYTAVVGGPGYVVAAPPPEAEVAPAPAPSKPDPIIYPRNGQSAQQLEADRQDCNRWATTQPAAMQDGSVFNRAVEACMDGRGYTMR